MNKAIARIKGSDKYPELMGVVTLCQTKDGVQISAKICNLPQSNSVFGFHIHEGRCCSGDIEDPFKDAKGHYNPERLPHPYHRGDLPPLFSNHGDASMCMVTDRFKLQEVIGRVIIIHSKPDDFTSQPSGNSGEKIACGIIEYL